MMSHNVKTSTYEQWFIEEWRIITECWVMTNEQWEVSND